jgi:hypothetical protein
MQDVELAVRREGGTVTACAAADGATAVELTITDHCWRPVSHLYQSFMTEERGTYLARITMEGQQSEHEKEAGRINLYDHPFHRHLAISEVQESPFREVWMRDGVQIFEPFVLLRSV